MAGPVQGDELARYELRDEDVTGLRQLGKTKGSGAYGAVYEVTVKGVRCIAKRIHEILVDEEVVSQNEKDSIQEKFRRECVLLSKLKHPNIVHFVGVHYGRDRNDISLVMEQLFTDLARFVEPREAHEIPLSVKISILLDVVYGLHYMHGLSPPMIHRDLNANNILLTSTLQAKVADLGVSKLLDRAMTRHSKAPGMSTFMPPEALKDDPVYGKELDVFSFGHLALFTCIQQFPVVDEPRYTDEEIAHARQGTVSILRRRKSLDQMGKTHPLRETIVHCLRDRSEERPSTEKLVQTLMYLHSSYPASREEVDATLPANMQAKDTRLDTLTERLQTKEWQVITLTGDLQAKDQEVATLMGDLQGKEVLVATLTGDLQTKERQVAALTGNLQAKHWQVATLTGGLQAKEEQVATLTCDLQTKERQVTTLVSDLQAKELQVATLTGDMQAKERQVTTLTGDLQAKECQITTLTGDLQAKEHQVTTLTSDLQAKECQITTLTGDLQAKEHQVTTLTSDLQAKECQIATVMDELQANGEQVATLTGDLQAKERQITSLTVELQTKEEQLATLMGDLQLKERQVGTLTDNLRAKKHQVAILMGGLQAKEQQVSTLMGNLQAKERQVATLMGDLHAKEQQVAISTGDLQGKEVQVVTLMDELRTKERQVTTLTDGLLAKEGQVATLMDELQAKEEQVATLTGSLQAKEDEVTTMTVGNQAKDKKLDTLMDEVRAQDKRIATMEDRLQAKEEELQTKEEKIAHLTSSMQAKDKQIFILKNEVRMKEEPVTTLNASLQDELQKAQSVIRQQQQRIQQLSSAKQEVDQFQVVMRQQKQQVQQLRSPRHKLKKVQPDVTEYQKVTEQLTSENQQLLDQLIALYDNARAHERAQDKMAEESRGLNQRVTELQEVQANQEKELGLLRDERAMILLENTLLREGSDPENYARIKEEYAALVVQLQEAQLALLEQRALIQRLETAYQCLQQNLADATDPKQLQTISSLLECYRQERDQGRKQIEILQGQLLALHMGSKDKLTGEIQEASESQGQLAQMKGEMLKQEIIARQQHEQTQQLRQELEQAPTTANKGKASADDQ